MCATDGGHHVAALPLPVGLYTTVFRAFSDETTNDACQLLYLSDTTVNLIVRPGFMSNSSVSFLLRL